MAKVPEKFWRFFWEVDPEEIDTERYPDYIIGRILEYGTLEAVKWVRTTFGDEKLKEYVSGAGKRRLSAQTLNFWQKMLDLEPEECTKRSSTKTRSRHWNS